MKKLLILSAMMLLAGTAFGQTLQKGNLIGVHVMTIDLKPGVTMDQFKEFYVNSYIPAFEKELPGCKLFLLEGIRGENKDSFGLLFYFNSVKDRNKYFNEDGSNSALAQKASDNLAPVTEEMNKLGTATTKYTDWIIQ